jgi:hypothetical protein
VGRFFLAARFLYNLWAPFFWDLGRDPGGGNCVAHVVTERGVL